MQPLRIGIDFDGVIADHHPHKMRLAKALGYDLESWQLNSNVLRNCVTDAHYDALRNALYGEMTLEAPPVPGAFETLARLPGELYVVSARRPENEAFPRLWMEKHRLDEIIPLSRVLFCKEGKEKRVHCERLGLAAFLDDKLSYLAHLPPEVQRVLFDVDGVAPRLSLPDDIRIARDWQEFLAMTKALASLRTSA